MQSTRLAESNKFWTRELKDARPCIVRPGLKTSVEATDMENESSTTGTIDFTIEITHEIKEFCKTAQITMSNLLQFAWALLLRKYTDNKTACYGYLLSDRDIDIPNSNIISGPMLCLMIGQVNLQNEIALVNALQALQEHNINSLSHRSLDLTTLEKGLEVGDEKRLFNTLVNYRKVQAEGVEKTRFKKIIWKQDLHDQDLVLSFNDHLGGKRLDGQLAYYEDMFKESHIRDMVDFYLEILRSLCIQRYMTVEDLILGIGEWQC